MRTKSRRQLILTVLVVTTLSLTFVAYAASQSPNFREWWTISTLNYGGLERRIQLLRELSESQSPRAVPAIVHVVKSEHRGEVHDEAIRALARYGPAVGGEAIGSILGALASIPPGGGPGVEVTGPDVLIFGCLHDQMPLPAWALYRIGEASLDPIAEARAKSADIDLDNLLDQTAMLIEKASERAKWVGSRK